MTLVRRMPEMIEADAEQRPHRSEARDMAAEVALYLVGLGHHHHRVPAGVGAYPLLHQVVAGGAILELRRDRVDVGGVRGKRNNRAGSAGLVDQAFKQVVGAFRPLLLDHGCERVEPLLGFDLIRIVCGGRIGYGGHGSSLRGHYQMEGAILPPRTPEPAARPAAPDKPDLDFQRVPGILNERLLATRPWLPNRVGSGTLQPHCKKTFRIMQYPECVNFARNPCSRLPAKRHPAHRR